MGAMTFCVFVFVGYFAGGQAAALVRQRKDDAALEVCTANSCFFETLSCMSHAACEEHFTNFQRDIDTLNGLDGSVDVTELISLMAGPATCSDAHCGTRVHQYLERIVTFAPTTVAPSPLANIDAPVTAAPTTMAPTPATSTTMTTVTTRAVHQFDWASVVSEGRADGDPDLSLWADYPDLFVPMTEAAMVKIEDTLVFIGQGSKATFLFDIEQELWSVGSERPHHGDHHSSVTYRGEGYFIGGWGSNSHQNSNYQMQIYNAATNEWRLGAPYPGTAKGSHAAVVLGDNIYCCTGLFFTHGGTLFSPNGNSNGNHNPTDCHRYDGDLGRWFQIASLDIGVNHAAAGTDGRRMYVFGGRTTQANIAANGITALQIYDPVTDSWSRGTDMPIARGGMGNAPYINGKFYIMGGETGNNVFANEFDVFPQVHTYDPITDTWEYVYDMLHPVHGMWPIADYARNRIYIVGGAAVAGAGEVDTFQVLYAVPRTTASSSTSTTYVTNTTSSTTATATSSTRTSATTSVSSVTTATATTATATTATATSTTITNTTATATTATATSSTMSTETTTIHSETTATVTTYLGTSTTITETVTATSATTTTATDTSTTATMTTATTTTQSTTTVSSTTTSSTTTATSSTLTSTTDTSTTTSATSVTTSISSVTTTTATLSTTATHESDVALRVNCGGPSFTDTAGRSWVTDAGMTNTGKSVIASTLLVNENPVPGYDLKLYNTAHEDPKREPILEYKLPISETGTYRILLHFIVNNFRFQNVGDMVFHVDFGNTRLLDTFDPIKEGAGYNGILRYATVYHTGGTFSLKFPPVEGKPTIAAIEVIRVYAPPPTAPTLEPTAAPTAEPVVTETPTAAPFKSTESPSALTASPTATPAADPTAMPTSAPVESTASPTASPAIDPTAMPTAAPVASTSTPTAAPNGGGGGGIGGVSASTCAELGWPFKWNNFDVCGQSTIAGACHKKTASFSNAETLCLNEGGRLCTEGELQANAAAGTGCSIDGDLIWSSSECPDGRFQRRGKDDGSEAVCTTDLQTTASVRCCADTGDTTVPPTIVATPSAESCANLMWPFKYGNTDVCGQSTIGGQCHKNSATYAEAEQLCSADGGRLCTQVELQANAAAGTGCSIDDNDIWSQSPCADGGILTRHGKDDGAPAVCRLDLDEKLSVRCCADSGETTPMPTIIATPSAQSCSDLSWPFKFGNTDVCGQSTVDGECHKNSATHAEAEALCEADGGRLCTQAELQGNAAAGTGCSIDNHYIWSQSPCTGGYFIRRGKDDGAAAVCETDVSQQRSVRCCADSGETTPMPTIVATPSAQSCSDLSWPFKFGNADVCGQSTINGECHKNSATFSAAESLCETDGGRLCTQAELQANAAAGTGCSIDNHYIWSQSPCAGGYFVRRGKDDGSAAVCETDVSQQRSVRCCADIGATTPLPTIIATPSAQSCSALSWPFKYGNTDVCGQSTINGACHKNSATYAAAEALCETDGGRLCTQAELQANAAAGTGCSIDNHFIWSQSPCSGGMFIRRGADDGAPAVCETNLVTPRSVRCCADVGA